MSFLAGRTITDLDELNRQVAAWCATKVAGRPDPDDQTLTVGEAWLEEKPRLRALPDDLYPVHDRVEVKVGRTPYVRFDRNDHSVPHDHVRRTLVVLATPETVRVLDGDTEVARHARSFDKRAVIEDPKHLAALVAWKRKARADRGMDRLRHAVPSSPKLLEGAASRGHNLGSATAALLRLLDTWGAEAVESAVQHALEADALHVAAVRQILEQRAQDAGTPPPIAVPLPDDPKVRNLHVQPHDRHSRGSGRSGGHFPLARPLTSLLYHDALIRSLLRRISAVDGDSAGCRALRTWGSRGARTAGGPQASPIRPIRHSGR